ncbi:MAG: hypothetical protein SPF30_00470 [Arcanobacterium sp.]|nr:hypothetical protein [Arcanobacterium sp.]
MQLSGNDNARERWQFRALLLAIFSVASVACGVLLYFLKVELLGVSFALVGSIFNRYPLVALIIVSVGLLGVACAVMKPRGIVAAVMALLAWVVMAGWRMVGEIAFFRFADLVDVLQLILAFACLCVALGASWAIMTAK